MTRAKVLRQVWGQAMVTPGDKVLRYDQGGSPAARSEGQQGGHVEDAE